MNFWRRKSHTPSGTITAQESQGCVRSQAEQRLGSKPVSRVPPWILLWFQLECLTCIPPMMSDNLEVQEEISLVLSKLLLVMVFTTTIENKLKRMVYIRITWLLWNSCEEISKHLLFSVTIPIPEGLEPFTYFLSLRFIKFFRISLPLVCFFCHATSLLGRASVLANWGTEIHSSYTWQCSQNHTWIFSYGVGLTSDQRSHCLSL